MKKNKLLVRTISRIAHQVGKVLCDGNCEAVSRKELYVISGVSYDNVALVRLFEHTSMNDVLKKKCYRLYGKITLPVSFGVIDMPLYADVTKLIIKEFRSCMYLLNKQNEPHNCMIPKDDMRHIITLIRNVNTIPENIKDKYLSV